MQALAKVVKAIPQQTPDLGSGQKLQLLFSFKEKKNVYESIRVEFSPPRNKKPKLHLKMKVQKEKESPILEPPLI